MKEKDKLQDSTARTQRASSGRSSIESGCGVESETSGSGACRTYVPVVEKGVYSSGGMVGWLAEFFLKLF